MVNVYGFYDVPSNGFKYIHCDLIDASRYLTIILTIGSTFVTTFSPCLNVGFYIQIISFGVTFINKFERGDWGLDFRVGLINMIEDIDLIPITLCFIATHTIRSFMRRESLEVI